MNRLKATIVLSLLAATAVAQETDHHETQHTIECEARVASPQVQAARRVMAGGPLSLQTCRDMALGYNKTLASKRVQREMAAQMRKSARTKYLPSLDVMGGAIFSSREISILNNTQKSALKNIGTSLGGLLGISDPKLQGTLNHLGQDVVDGFRTNNRAMYMASAMVTQPIYMGGAITAANNIADINEKMAAVNEELARQNTLQNIDQTYWTVVSLRHKLNLANSFLQLVQKLDDDVQKMITAGVATKADGLKVSVKVNEAEMAVTQVEDGLSLAKMLLCQTCGMPVESDITLADEAASAIAIEEDSVNGADTVAYWYRPELELLSNTVDISRQATKLARASYLPQVLLSGGYLMTNPNVYDGFTRKFAGVWNVGVVVRIPVWHWMDGTYKVRAAKAATTIAELELAETQEKVDLQVSQCSFKLKEARKKYAMATKNVDKAEENLRCANVGFKEGVLQTTDVMEAQTAWMQAQSQKIDSEVEIKIAQVNLKKAIGQM